MIVLAIDTAGADCSAAVFDSGSGQVLAAVTEMIGKGHAERLMAVIDEALAKADRALSDVQRVAVVTGPGSFTGIRVGVAAARGLALALSAECVGVTTLDTLGQGYLESNPQAPLVVAMDAKRGELYVQAFAADGSPMTRPAAMPPEEAADLARSHSAEVVGSGRPLVLQDPAVASVADRFDISTVARLGAQRSGDGERPKPLYLRGPDAKPQTGYALARA
ncbi:tRNA threonylcarbamoyl adenosine modification protein YeaZ [Pseudorhizobium tarimense]|uniref:tRNA threonylcarbamoyl adenosine modification protein YeaZ n=1 Tax=Pseudorhizobium tarimense TaxID=1079109 RepID=A0ABV2H9M9_9HYPH|nr:tRNA (adenosine(37)-N6)-threonylcarbamoyltransferase complex dimerization subunit type 1 TsaB [Pseudorhizobium tarimense]MCJ8520417.1 tRNA (adenosine(37)-N6)-threonylcarbamoyltransferase complex dimerization subunit type 1 TsaB [Pseudorhizobium tarimense]